MAAEGRTNDSSLAGSELESQLRGEPFTFEFFQAVRLLERIFPDRLPVGGFGAPSAEVARFSANPSVVFPPSEIQSLEVKDGQPPALTVNFMGLTGPEGVLPLWYTAALIEQVKNGSTSMRDFLDIFNHRSISLFFRAWQKYRFGISYERGERDNFFLDLLALIGLGTPGLAGRQGVADEALVFHAGLLAMRQRSAATLEQLLHDYFDVPVRIEQLVGAWYRLNPADRCCLDETGTSSQELGLGAVLGDETWEYQSSAKIVLGPLTLAQYLDFLPTGSAYEPLRALTRFYANDEIEFEIQLIMLREEVPRCRLESGEDSGPQLGWVSWMTSEKIDRDPTDTKFRL